MILSEQIASLQTQLAAAQAQARQNFADLTAVRADLETANTNLTAVTAEREQLRIDLAAVTADRDTARTEITAERESRETAINAQVTQRLADAGVEPVRRDPSAAVDTAPAQSCSARQRLAAHINANLK